MRPQWLAGESASDVSAADLLAMDVIGWTLTTAVPEPAVPTMLAIGLLYLVSTSLATRKKAGLAPAKNVSLCPRAITSTQTSAFAKSRSSATAEPTLACPDCSPHYV
jgi:hypothetical protein